MNERTTRHRPLPPKETLAKVGNTIFWSLAVLIVGAIIVGYAWESYDNYKFNHLSPAEHLTAAQDLCRSKQFAAFCVSDYASEAAWHLEKIPSTSPEYRNAQELLTTIHQQEQREQRERQEQEEAEAAQKKEPLTGQKKRDQDAEIYSYLPTTLRVDTDMDAFWLNNEERTCQTYPDDRGRVAIVACNASGSHREHNIPVTF